MDIRIWLLVSRISQPINLLSMGKEVTACSPGPRNAFNMSKWVLTPIACARNTSTGHGTCVSHASKDHTVIL